MKVLFLCERFFPMAILAGGTSVGLFEQFGESHSVVKTHRAGNDRNRQVSSAQQLAGLLQFQVQQVLFGGDMVFFVENPGQVVGVDAEVVGHLF